MGGDKQRLIAGATGTSIPELERLEELKRKKKNQRPAPNVSDRVLSGALAPAQGTISLKCSIEPDRYSNR